MIQLLDGDQRLATARTSLSAQFVFLTGKLAHHPQPLAVVSLISAACITRKHIRVQEYFPRAGYHWTTEVKRGNANPRRGTLPREGHRTTSRRGHREDHKQAARTQSSKFPCYDSWPRGL